MYLSNLFFFLLVLFCDLSALSIRSILVQYKLVQMTQIFFVVIVFRLSQNREKRKKCAPPPLFGDIHPGRTVLH